MEQKMITIPFDVKLAKEINNGTKPGKIVTRNGKNVRIICWDRNSIDCPIVALYTGDSNREIVLTFTLQGRSSYYNDTDRDEDILLQIPEYTTFKNGDIIYCEVDNGGGDYCKWISILKGGVEKEFGNLSFHAYAGYINDASIHVGCLAFNDYSNNIGMVRLATEEEKQKLIDALKESKELRAKEYLKRFFGIEEKPKCEFKPFDSVLVRDGNRDKWKADLFSHRIEDDSFPYMCVSEAHKYCIPYNEKTAYLLGNTDNWEE